MKTHKKVTYTLTKDTLIEIDNIKLMKFADAVAVTKSSIIKDCLLKGFGVFESELVQYGKDYFKDTPKKYPNTTPITVTLPIEIVDRLDYYSQKLGLKKSHLVMSSVFLNGELG